MNKESELKLAIQLAVCGYLFKEGAVTDIPEILREIADDYYQEIKKYKQK